MGALLAGAALVLAIGGVSATAQAQQQATRAFNIRPQSLPAALTIFGQQSGLQVSVNADSVRGLKSPGASGTMSAQDALDDLLGETGLTFRFTSPTTVVISKREAVTDEAPDSTDGSTRLEPIVVQGEAMRNWISPPSYAGGQVATGARVGLLGNLNVMDTPFNQTSYTSKRIQDTQSATVAEALQDNPSVRTLVNGDKSSYFEQLAIRGFKISSYNYLFGGLPGILPYNSTASELADRVEVLMGPSTLINGMPSDGAVGGTVNIAPKRADDTPLTELNTFYRSNGTIGEHVDFGRRYGENKEFGIRFNGVYGAGDTNITDQDKRSTLATLGLDYQGERFRLSADLGYQSNRTDNATISDFYLADGVPIPPALNGSKQAVSPWSYSDTEGRFGVVRGEFDPIDDLTLYAALGISESDFSTNTLVSHTILDTAGDFLAMPYRVDSAIRRTAAQAGLRWHFDTDVMTHRFALQYDRTTENADVGLAIGSAPIFSNLDNLSNIPDPGLAAVPKGKQSEGVYSGVSAIYSMEIFDGRLILMGGLRQQYIENQNYDVFTHAVGSKYSDHALSPMAAISVKPWENVTLYANYTQGLTPGTVVPPGYANVGVALPAFETTQAEASVKVDWGSFTTTLSVFEITQPSDVVDIATNTLAYDGEQRNRGVELNFFGELTGSVRVLGGLMLLDPRLTKTQGGVNDGKVAVASSRFQANVGAEWDTPFLPGLSLNGRLTYTGPQYLDLLEPRRIIPSWTRVDVGARYTIDRDNGEPITIRFNVDNLFDAEYWTSRAYDLMAGEPRTFKLSTSFRF
jgi:iron complex outermembrane receptor protein